MVDIGAELERIGAAVRGGNADLRALGFWPVVGRVKRDPALVARYADRIGQIDRDAFRRGVRIRVPVWVGNTLLVGSIGAGGVAVALAGVVSSSSVWAGLLVVAAGGIWSVGFHSPTHWVVGRLAGIRFSAYCLRGRPPYPGLKIDYASYLRADPGRRAWMHASGAIGTKVAPFLALAFVPVVDAPGWSAVVLVAMGLVEIATDVLLSVKRSDWKRFLRERAVARAVRAG
jgi:hypothetical protein